MPPTPLQRPDGRGLRVLGTTVYPLHGKRHRAELSRTDIEAFLNSLAHRHLSASSQAQALNALVFLYRDVLETPLDWLEQLDRPRRAQKLPAVLTLEQVGLVLQGMTGPEQLMARLIYGSGMSIGECITLPVKDLLWTHQTIHIQSGKGAKDRTTLLPTQLTRELRAQVDAVATLHAKRVARGQGYAPMPDALGRKFAAASRSLAWQ